MKQAKEFVITEDDNGHWYVIPYACQAEFEEYVEHLNANEDEEEWEGHDFGSCRVRGALNIVLFTNYRIIDQ